MSSWVPSLPAVFGGGSGKEDETGQQEEEQSPQFERLEDGDAGFTHLADAGPDSGVFAVREARKRPKQPDRGASRIIALPKGHYKLPPQLAKGLKSCNLSHTSKDQHGKQAIDLNIAIHTELENSSTMRPSIQAWNSNESTQLIYDCEMVWMEAKQWADDCMLIGTTFDLANGEKKKEIKFPRPLQEGLEIEIGAWIQDFRFGTQDGGDYAVDCWASKLTQDGFIANASGSKSAERLTVTWIIYKKGKRRVASGTFSTEDGEDRKDNAAQTKGRVEFPEGTFDKPPTVLAGLGQFDLAGGRDLRIGVDVKDVDANGFTWELNTWGKGSEDALRSAEATYIALGFA